MALRWNGPIPCHPVDAACCVYIEVPKAGATSVKWALSPFKGGPPGNDAEDIHPWFGYTEARDIAQLYEWLDGRWENYFRFTVVRDPIRRFRSFYYGMGPGEDISRYVLEDFERDERWWGDIHVVPQTQLIGAELGHFDFVGHTEDMAEVQRKLQANVATKISVPHRNRGTAPGAQLSAEANRHLRRIYAEDYRVLGYA